jgi:DNA-binding MarR family transcriptional regulator
MSNPRSPQFGAILYRASELIGVQGAEVFERLGIGLHASKISIVLAINAHGPMTSTELAERIGHSRQLVETKLKPSVVEGFFIASPDPNDSRRRVYDFSPSARPEVERILDVMLNFETVYAAIWDEVGTDIETAILKMERALAEQSLTTRLCRQFPAHALSIEDVT